MKIIHCCLSNYYIDNYNYQENLLSLHNFLDGHDVKILASTEVFLNNAKLGYVSPREYLNEHGILVSRIPYSRIPIHYLRKKIRSYQGTYHYLEKEKPDVILFHGLPAWDIMAVARYKKNNPQVKLYADSHEDIHNSARNYLSYAAHRFFYKLMIQEAYPYIDKILYYSLEAKDFIQKVYGLPNEKMEFFPLGGIVFSEDEYHKRRMRVREELGLSENQVMFMHSGKLDKQKKTEDILHAVKQIREGDFLLVIAGNMSQEVQEPLTTLINADARVKYVGWKGADELLSYLCAADVYLQPGSQSATLQNAICCRCAIVVYPHKSHTAFLRNNGFFTENIEEMVHSLKVLISKRKIIHEMQNASKIIGEELLDYRLLARKITNT